MNRFEFGNKGAEKLEDDDTTRTFDTYEEAQQELINTLKSDIERYNLDPTKIYESTPQEIMIPTVEPWIKGLRKLFDGYLKPLKMKWVKPTSEKAVLKLLELMDQKLPEKVKENETVKEIFKKAREFNAIGFRYTDYTLEGDRFENGKKIEGDGRFLDTRGGNTGEFKDQDRGYTQRASFN